MIDLKILGVFLAFLVIDFLVFSLMVAKFNRTLAPQIRKYFKRYGLITKSKPPFRFFVIHLISIFLLFDVGFDFLDSKSPRNTNTCLIWIVVWGCLMVITNFLIYQDIRDWWERERKS